MIAIIEGVEKPGNLGAILRTADGAGVDAVIVAESATDLFNPNIIRASLGAVFAVPVTVASSGEVLAWLKQRRIGIIAARSTGRSTTPTPITAAPRRSPSAVKHAAYLTRGAQLALASVHVPMLGVADSLNVSVTAAVLFYEARRQRGRRGRDS